MKQKKILVFGGSGQIGRHLIKKLAKNNYIVTVVTRNLHQKAYILKTQANAGYINLVEASIYDEKKIRNLISRTDICINLIGILFEKKNSTFKNIHTNFPSFLAAICKEYNVEQFIHLSALGIETSTDSNYAQSKLNGELIIKKNFPKATILRPSIVYSVDDNFTTSFMTLLSLLPIFPLYYNGKTKFMPINCSDLTEVIFFIISKNTNSQIIECVGPETITLKEILIRLLKLINKKRFLLPLPLSLAKFSSKLFQLFPKPLITEDQLRLLAHDNILSGKYKTNFDIGVPSLRTFDKEVKTYCYMWRKEGKYSTEKYR